MESECGKIMTQNRNFETKNIHFEGAIDSQTGASSTPIIQASTFHQEDVLNGQEFDYTRSGNPTRQALEGYIAQLENGQYGYAFASGMAAISSALMILSSGDHIVCTEDVYGGTYRLLTTILPRMNIETTFVDMTDLEAVKQAIKPNTKVIYMETPSNPTLKITNIKKVVSIAKEKEILTMLDNTFMTPLYQRPLDLGVDVVLHSASKFLGGHSDLIAGVVVVNDKPLAIQIKQIQNGLGNMLGVHDSWLLMRGMKTLSARMKTYEQNARTLAKWLDHHEKVERVYYPGLMSHPHHDIHKQQATGFGAIVSFDVGTEEKALKVMNEVTIPIVAVSLGAVESILSYPAKMSHAAMPKEVRHERGIGDGLMRLSVGLEHVDDLIADLKQALEKI